MIRWGKQGVSGIIRKMELLKEARVLKKNMFVTLVRDGKEDLIRKGGTMPWRFVIGERDGSQL